MCSLGRAVATEDRLLRSHLVVGGACTGAGAGGPLGQVRWGAFSFVPTHSWLWQETGLSINKLCT